MGLQITKSRSPNSDKFWGNSNIVKGNHGNLLTDPLHPRISNMDNWTAVDLHKKYIPMINIFPDVTHPSQVRYQNFNTTEVFSHSSSGFARKQCKCLNLTIKYTICVKIATRKNLLMAYKLHTLYKTSRATYVLCVNLPANYTLFIEADEHFKWYVHI